MKIETVGIAEIRNGQRHRKELGDIAALAASIRDVGLLQPVVIRPDRQLVAGERRLAAVKLLGWQSVPAHVAESLDDAVRLLQAERDENTQRLPFAPSEMVDMGASLEIAQREEAKKRQQEHGNTAPGRPGNTPENFTEVSKGRAEDKVASALGVSRPTYAKAKKVVEAAKKNPKRQKYVDEMDRTGRVNGVYRKLLAEEQAEQINQEPPPLPTGPFRVIAVDPPWPYEKRAEDPSHRASLPYPPMTLDDIKALPVAKMATDDGILWLWTTNAHMPVAFEVLTAWGFTHKTILTWEKDRMGTGDWLRGKTEHCLLAVKGHPTVTLSNQTTILHAPMREHSRKPDEFYALVESLCPGSKLEMFARERRDGWTPWGSETERFSETD